MAFVRPTLNEIYNRMRADAEQRLTEGQQIPDYASRSKITRYSLLSICLIVFSGAVHLCYGFLENLAVQFFPDSCDDSFVPLHAARYGLKQKAARFAVGSFKVDTTTGTVIPTGAEIKDNTGIVYLVDTGVTVAGGTATLAVTAKVAGTAGNNPSLPLTFVSPLPGPTTITIVTAPNGGADTETIDALRFRVIQRRKNPPSSGNIADYERWAGEVTGVMRAWCVPAELFKGPGTVGVICAGVGMVAVDSSVITDVTDHIRDVQPVGAIPEVLPITPLIVDHEIAINPLSQANQDNVRNLLQDTYDSDAEPAAGMPLSHINTALAGAGLLDYRIVALTFKGVRYYPPIDVTATTTEVAVLGSITFTGI